MTICTLLHVQVTLGVLDANDNSPVFLSDLVVFQTAENQMAPLEIGSVVVTDVDEGNLSNMAGNHREDKLTVWPIYFPDVRRRHGMQP